MTIRFVRWGVLLATAAILSGLRLTPVISARSHASGEFDRRNLDRDRDGDNEPRHLRHVFVIVLENEGFDTTFGPQSKAPYLSKTLTKAGVLLTQYYGTGHASLDNYVAMISGQGATPETRNDCQTYADFVMNGLTPDGQAIGHGCVYPDVIKTLPDQLNAVGKTWRAYLGDMGNDPSRESATCGHPVLNTLDHTQSAEVPSAAVPLGDQYAGVRSQRRESERAVPGPGIGMGDAQFRLHHAEPL